ncbi:GDSL-type esterase/lipase family protein [Granulicella arctica]|uniref:Lysophospholipase L1-like esterase n=1 Tax=Granulicella arctica TaxID=940613 RepID=A0A7Y9TS32_9BACT|nr:lysophospholipase L1-like esterase [Granulicella arctica]
MASWADAPSTATGGSQSELTIREIVKPTVGSRGTVRLHFSNYFGTTPITLGAVHIGKQTTGAGVTDDTPVSFSGAGAVTIPAGGTVTSDTVSLNFSYGDILSITEYVSGSWSSLTAHAQGVNVVTNYVTAANAGNKTEDTAGTSFVYTTFNTFLLDRVDVYGDYKETIAAFGSSTTDGYHSGLDQHMTYPEQLAAALQAAGHDDIAVANVGIYGTTVLGSDATAGVNRFSRDVLSLPNVTTVIDYLGANDLRTDCTTAANLIAGKQNLIAQAHAASLKIYEGITAPSTFCGAQNPDGFGTRFPQGSGEEAERFLLNAWQVSTQSSVVDGVTVQPPTSDGVIDFNAAIVDPTSLSYMLPAFDSGDDIHPNAAGYGAMAKAIPLTFF